MKKPIPPLPERANLYAKPIEIVVDYLVERDATLRQQIDHANQRVDAALGENERLRRLLVQMNNRMFGPRRDSVAGEIDDLSKQPMLNLDLRSCDNNETLIASLQTTMSEAANDDQAKHKTTTSEGKRPWVRKNLPPHLQREIRRYWPDGLTFDGEQPMCGTCNATVRTIGEDSCEQLEYIPAQFKVIVHTRPKFVCTCCNNLLQAKAPARPVAQGSIGPAFAARILANKFERHMPLNRQSKECTSLGVEVSPSLMSNWAVKLGGQAGLEFDTTTPFYSREGLRRTKDSR